MWCPLYSSQAEELFIIHPWFALLISRYPLFKAFSNNYEIVVCLFLGLPEFKLVEFSKISSRWYKYVFIDVPNFFNHPCHQVLFGYTVHAVHCCRWFLYIQYSTLLYMVPLYTVQYTVVDGSFIFSTVHCCRWFLYIQIVVDGSFIYIQYSTLL